jgi:hypothetical protein
MKKRSLTLLVWLSSALAAACGGDNAAGPKPAAPELVLTRLEVAPDSTFLLPLDDQQLTISAWDQFGTRRVPRAGDDWAPEATYVSSDSAVARVASGGRVTGLTPGVARITASLTIANRTLTGSMTVKVGEPIAGGAAMKMDQFGHWTPYKVRLKAPATVTWVIPDGVQARTIWLNVWSANPEKLEFVHGRATRTFSRGGVYYYGTGGGLMWYEQGGVVVVF